MLAAVLAGTAYAVAPPIREGGILRVNVSASISSLDPAIDYTTSGYSILSATCAKLVTFPDTSGSASALAPEVAARLPQVSNGGRTYTFSIRPGFEFETGEAVTAQDFAWALNRDLAPAMHSPAAGFIGDVVGAAAVLRGSATSASGIAASGDTLRVTLVRPAPDFPARMAMSFFCAIPLATPARPQGYKPIPMAGPYYIASATGPLGGTGTVVLKQNPDYGGSRPHHLSEIDFTLGTDATTSILQIAGGGADYDAGNLDPGLLRSLAARHRLGTAQLSVHPDLELLFLALNTRRPLFQNARLRKAVNLAVDRADILSRTGLYGKATDQILPAAMPGYRNVKIYPLARPDLRSARRLAGPRTRHALFYFGGSLQFTIAELVASQLAKIGIQVDVEPYPSGIRSNAAATHRADITIVDWTADYVDPYDFINLLLYGKTANAPGSENRGGFDNPLYDTRMTQAAALGGRARLTAYGRLDADLMRNAAPIVPLADVYLPALTSGRVRPDCSVFPPQGAGLDLAAACLK